MISSENKTQLQSQQINEIIGKLDKLLTLEGSNPAKISLTPENFKNDKMKFESCELELVKNPDNSFTLLSTLTVPSGKAVTRSEIMINSNSIEGTNKTKTQTSERNRNIHGSVKFDMINTFIDRWAKEKNFSLESSPEQPSFDTLSLRASLENSEDYNLTKSWEVDKDYVANLNPDLNVAFNNNPDLNLSIFDKLTVRKELGADLVENGVEAWESLNQILDLKVKNHISINTRASNVQILRSEDKAITISRDVIYGDDSMYIDSFKISKEGSINPSQKEFYKTEHKALEGVNTLLADWLSENS